jgi:hypothetical protein
MTRSGPHVATLLLSLLLAAPPLQAQEAEPEPQPDDAPDSCPTLFDCCVPGEEPCWHPKAGRGMLALGSGAGLAGGIGGFLVLGDSLGSGDPFGGIAGAGFVGLVGAALGALVASATPRGETRVHDRPGRPTLTLSLDPGGERTFDERAPPSFGLSLDPTFVLHDAVVLQPHFGLSTGLGPTVEVDPRPQLQSGIDGQDGGFPVVWRRHGLKVSAGAELTIKLPYPMPVKRPLATGRLEIRYRPRFELRRRTYQPGEPDERSVEHIALYPALFGLRWHVSPRQRFTVYMGPRLDLIGYSDVGGGGLGFGKAYAGAFHVEAWYHLDVPMTPLGRGATSVTGRFGFGYVHTMLDGNTFDLGPMVGFLGPLEASFDLRIRKRDAPVALQLGIGVRVGVGGGPFFEVGLVAPQVRGGAR